MFPHNQSQRHLFHSSVEAPHPRGRVGFGMNRQPQQEQPMDKHREGRIDAHGLVNDDESDALIIRTLNMAHSSHQIESESSQAHLRPPTAESSRPTKRAKTETSRATMSYPRKRAVAACQLCRMRKTKCSNTRPQCKFCTDTGAVCVYEDPLDHSSFDPASLVMLDRLNQILERLDTPLAYLPLQNVQVPPLHVQPSPVSSLSQPLHGSKPEPESEPLDTSDEEYMKIPSSRTTADTILLWPIFEGKYPPNFWVEAIFEGGVDSESDDEIEDDSGRKTHRHRPGAGSGIGLSSGAVEENVLRLVENFLVNVHTKNPILDAVTLKRYARRIAEDGPRWDGKSCLVLLACALGSIARPFSESWAESSKAGLGHTDKSSTHARPEIKIAEHYYGLARKRIGLLNGTIIRSQCYLLSGVYLMYVLRPLEAWQNFLEASNTYYVYLKGRMQKAQPEHQLFNRTRRLEQRLYWSCFKSECEIRVELALPESSIASLRYPDMFPSPPNEESTDHENVIIDDSSHSDLASPSSSTDISLIRRRRTDSIDHTQKLSWYYYLTEIALRRIGNRILNALYTNKTGLEVPMTEMLKRATTFEDEFLQWEATLPKVLYYDHANLQVPPREELAYMVRGRTFEIKHWLYRPFLYHAIHYPESDPYRPLIQHFVDKAIEHSTASIRGMCFRHRHHGIWYGLRTGTAAAFSIAAAVKCGHVEVMGWRETLEIQVGILRYWEEESADLRRAREVLEGMLEEFV